jgi:oligogalacturonide transport system substrate-binding protein
MFMLYNEYGRPFQVNWQIQYTVEEVEAVYEIIGRLIESGVMPTFEQQEPPHDSTNPVWMQGRAGSSLEWINLINNLVNDFNEGQSEMGVALVPNTGNAANSLILQRPSLVHVVSRNSAHPELAAYLLNFLYTDEEALLILGDAFGIPMSTTAWDIFVREGHMEGLLAEGIELQLANVGEMCEFFEGAVRADVRYPAMEAFRLGSINAREAAEMFVDGQQEVFDNMIRP